MKTIAIFTMPLLIACGSGDKCGVDSSQNSGSQQCLTGEISTDDSTIISNSSSDSATNGNASDGGSDTVTDSASDNSLFTVTHDIKGTAYPYEKVHFYIKSKQKDVSAFIDIGTSKINMQLYDDQTHGDTLAGDGRFTLEYEIQPGDDVSDAIITGRVLDDTSTLLATATATDLVSIASQGTLVPGGIMNSDTTWTISGSPYIIKSNVQLAATRTLTIDPGVIISFVDQSYLDVRGQINSVGTANAPIQYRKADIRLQWEGNVLSYRNDETYNAGPRFEYSDLPFGSMTVTGTGSSRGPYLKHVTLRSLQASMNNANGTAFGTYVQSCAIEGINIQYARYGKFKNSYIDRLVGTDLSDGDVEISNNQIGNLSLSSGSTTVQITKNNIKEVTWSRPRNSKINNNNIYGTTDDHLFVILHPAFSGAVDAKANYWGPTITSEMNSKGSGANVDDFLDFRDDSQKNEIDYSNWLNSPVSNAGPDWIP